MNDEIRTTNVETGSKDAFRHLSFVIWISFVIRISTFRFHLYSDFVIRHSCSRKSCPTVHRRLIAVDAPAMVAYESARLRLPAVPSRPRTQSFPGTFARRRLTHR